MKLTDTEILAAWQGAFDKPISLDHMPTADEILLIRIKAVLSAEEKKIGKGDVKLDKESRQELNQAAHDMIKQIKKEERQRMKAAGYRRIPQKQRQG